MTILSKELNERAQSLMNYERWFEAVALIESQRSHEDHAELLGNLGWVYFELG
jgi:hypothetical protein